MNICYCGTEASYPHAATCPFPYFGPEGTPEAARWYAAAAEIITREARAQGTPDLYDRLSLEELARLTPEQRRRGRL